MITVSHLLLVLYFGECVVPNTAPLNTLPLPHPTLPPLAAPSSQPSTTLSSSGQWLSKLCVCAPNCKRLANSFCTNCACKSCCLKVYRGCSGVRGHRDINPQPQCVPSIIPPLSQPTSTSSPHSWLILCSWLTALLTSYNSMTQHFSLHDKGFSQAAAEQQESFHLEAQGDAEFQKTIAGSLRGLPPSSPITTTSSLPNLWLTPPTATAFTMRGIP